MYQQFWMKDMNVPAVLNKGYKGSHTISDISSWCTNLKYIISPFQQKKKGEGCLGTLIPVCVIMCSVVLKCG